MMDDGLELAAQPWDATWRCLDLTAAGAPVDASRCAGLARASRAFFPRLPNGSENRESSPQ
jgi:hypothetical protein